MASETYSPHSAGLIATHSRFRRLLRREEWYNKRHGSDLVYRRREEIEVPDEIVPGEKYSKAQLGQMADNLLKDDARTEMCRQCESRGQQTGAIQLEEQNDEAGNPITDEEGNPLVLEFAQLECDKGHTWWQGEGFVRGIGGENPILFEEHLQSRRRREIYVNVGIPDPSIVQGIYNRSHPGGRKVNSLEARRKHGASWYR